MKLKEKISSLIEILKNSDIHEIEVSSFWGAQKIRVSNKKENNISLPMNIDKNEHIFKSDQKETIQESINPKDTSLDKLRIIKAPLVGTFYSAPKPGSPSFIKIGDKIKKGQVICIIEAMKIFNEIESDFSGTVVEILIDDGTPVEFDQDLVIIK